MVIAFVQAKASDLVQKRVSVCVCLCIGEVCVRRGSRRTARELVLAAWECNGLESVSVLCFVVVGATIYVCRSSRGCRFCLD